ncbi:hypothetical protein [Desulfurivibrio dismutans]|uniref:hypothetical protein n=1 Tax=Desulfurivibrio dismutans TaxID=1398908 RepID=UPI0023DBF4F1|nr:hypothetical protein [Desulfurivibrio alkaliphilus]MDF1615238.1 hypothetical protein [Desulfurivibrio alkaliphilus]
MKVDASLPAPIQALLRPPARVAAVLERAANELEAVKFEYESHYADQHRQEIVKLWEMITLLRPGSKKAQYNCAMAAMAANRRRKAEEIFTQLAADESTSRYCREAVHKVAALYWRNGREDQALQLVQSLPGSVENRHSEWLCWRIVRDGLHLMRRGKVEAGRRAVEAGWSGLPSGNKYAAQIAGVYAAIWGAEKPVPSKASKTLHAVDGPTAIVLSGFGWSGSGAVFDFLRNAKGVGDPFAGSEFRLWTGKDGLNQLYRLVSRRHRPAQAREALAEFLTRYCFGGSFQGFASEGRQNLWGRIAGARRGKLVRLAAGLVPAIVSKERSSRGAIEAFRDFSQGILEITAPSARYALLSNCLTAENIEAVELFRQPVVFVSWRDPRDSFLSKRAAFPGSVLDRQKWERQLTRRIKLYARQKKRVVASCSSWHDIAFEEFVCEPKCRAGILDVLDIEPETLDGGFSPEVSRKNIGIYRSAGLGTEWNQLVEHIERSRAECQALTR